MSHSSAQVDKTFYFCPMDTVIDGKCVGRISLSDDTWNICKFTEDGEYLVCGSETGSVRITNIGDILAKGHVFL